MKFKTLAKVLLPLAALFGSTTSFAGDEQVNCRSETSTQAIYEGTAFCTAYYVENNGSFRTQLLGGHFNAAPVQYRTVYSNFYGYDGNLYFAQCQATVPFSHNEQISTTVCDYTPKSSFTPHANGFNGIGRVNIVDNASDRDGSIVKTEWWVDGTYKGTTKPSLATYVTRTYSIRQRVTDNDGYTDESTRSIRVVPGDFDDCGRRGRDELCP
ncbi:hypothetical protein [Alteromonas sp. a30]|uniref:hypothetical protein n=1 Tax=Alteromonas sp. a30 TaxID=2730917 RepID=UPI00227DE19A|nr:hypothetical protein [Alteromonas sp. a30]MCY7296276.1 hypothetical protein [Alteromonas sp. a30]